MPRLIDSIIASKNVVMAIREIKILKRIVQSDYYKTECDKADLYRYKHQFPSAYFLTK